MWSCDAFLQFFEEKVKSVHAVTASQPSPMPSISADIQLLTFQPYSQEEVVILSPHHWQSLVHSIRSQHSYWKRWSMCCCHSWLRWSTRHCGKDGFHHHRSAQHWDSTCKGFVWHIYCRGSAISDATRAAWSHCGVWLRWPHVTSCFSDYVLSLASTQLENVISYRPYSASLLQIVSV